MTAIRCTTTLDMDPRDVVELDDARGTTLTVLRGHAWLTQHRDPRDIVLSAGDSWTIERDGVTLVEAAGDAALRVVGPGGSAARVRAATPAPPLPDRIRAGLKAVAAAFAPPRQVPYF